MTATERLACGWRRVIRWLAVSIAMTAPRLWAAWWSYAMRRANARRARELWRSQAELQTYADAAAFGDTDATDRLGDQAQKTLELASQVYGAREFAAELAAVCGALQHVRAVRTGEVAR